MALSKSTLVALGYSNLPDAFQSGREAAQLAKSQLAGESPDLILVFGPATAHFQDFIEGVRLVTGEKGLIGLPTHQVFTDDLLLPGNLVVLLRTDTIQFTLASSDYDPTRTTAALTDLLTQHREGRGNSRHQFEHHGLFLIDNVDPSEKKMLIQEATIETGLNSWLVSVTPTPSLSLPLICDDVVRSHGLIGVECLSTDPIGMGTVGIGSFQHQPHLYVEAARSAFREATEGMVAPPAACLILYDFLLDPPAAEELQAFIRRDDSPFFKLPVVGVSTACHGVKYTNRTGAVQKETIVVILLPQ